MAVTTKHAAAVRRIAPMTPARALVAMARPSQIALIWVVFASGALLGLGLTRPEAAIDIWGVAVAVSLITGAAVAAHWVNEAEDAATDRQTTRTAFSGGSGALEASGLDPSVPLRLGLLCAGVVAGATGVAWLAGALPGAAAAIVLAGLAGALSYSLPPLAAMRHGWGEVLNAILGGMLLPLAGVAVIGGAVRTVDALAFLPFTLVVFASVMATAWPDRVADAATDKATLQVRLRPATLRRIHAAATIGFVGTTVLVALSGAMPYALAGLLVLPALAVGMATYTRRTSPLPNVAAMVGLAIVLLITNSVAMLTGWSG